jgi:hypothetical protein
MFMNPYLILGWGLGTDEATALSARLSAWHDAMVAHERRINTGRTDDICHDECPHAEAAALWSDAVVTFGTRARGLIFLHSRAAGSPRHSKAGSTAREALSGAADGGKAVGQKRHEPSRRAAAALSPARVTAEVST